MTAARVSETAGGARVIGGGSLFALGVNGVVGVGIFFTPAAIGALAPGPLGALSYLVTALLLLPVALTAALLGRKLPVDGGPYVWARAAFGRTAGWMVGWVTGVSALISTAAVFVGVARQLASAFQSSFEPAWVVLCAATLSSVALLGLRPSAWAWNTLTVAKLVPLVLLLGLLFVPAPAFVERPPPSVPDYPRALLVALFPLQGFEVVPVLAGSVRGGKRTLTLATAGALGFAAALYAAIQLVCARALPNLGSSRAPLSDSAAVLGGPALESAVAFGANVSALGIAFGMIVMTPRYLSALGEHGTSLGFLSRKNSRGVPLVGVVITFGAVALLGVFESLESLFVLSSSAVLIQYVAASAALIRLSSRAELGLRRRAAVPGLLALFAIGLLARAVEPRELVVLGGLLVAGLLVLLAAWARERR